MNRKLAALGALPLLLALSSCYKIDAQFEVQEDSTVSGTMIAGLSKEVMEEYGSDPSEIFNEEEYPEGVEAESWENDDFVGEKLTFNEVTLENFNDQGEEFTIVKEGESFVMNLQGGDETSTEGMEEMMAEFPDPEVNFEVAFPGDITDHTGPGTVEGNTLVLDADDLTSGEDVRVVADASGGGLPIFLLLLAIGVLGLIGGGVFFLKTKMSGDGSGSDDSERNFPTPDESGFVTPSFGQPTGTTPNDPVQPLTPPTPPLRLPLHHSPR